MCFRIAVAEAHLIQSTLSNMHALQGRGHYLWLHDYICHKISSKPSRIFVTVKQ
jgi:hypothetical protein